MSDREWWAQKGAYRMIEIYGDWGVLHCDRDTGKVLGYDRANSDSVCETDGYHDVTKVDIVRYREENETVPQSIDIIHIGFWHGDNNEYCKPEEYLDED